MKNHFETLVRANFRFGRMYPPDICKKKDNI